MLPLAEDVYLLLVLLILNLLGGSCLLLWVLRGSSGSDNLLTIFILGLLLLSIGRCYRVCNDSDAHHVAQTFFDRVALVHLIQVLNHQLGALHRSDAGGRELGLSGEGDLAKEVANGLASLHRNHQVQ